MYAEVIELEGTWEEILQHSDELAGKRVRVVSVPAVKAPEPNGAPTKTLEERIIERSAAVPEEAWEAYPEDFLDHLDHYLYGTPKR